MDGSGAGVHRISTRPGGSTTRTTGGTRGGQMSTGGAQFTSSASNMSRAGAGEVANDEWERRYAAYQTGGATSSKMTRNMSSRTGISTRPTANEGVISTRGNLESRSQQAYDNSVIPGVGMRSRDSNPRGQADPFANHVNVMVCVATDRGVNDEVAERKRVELVEFIMREDSGGQLVAYTIRKRLKIPDDVIVLNCLTLLDELMRTCPFFYRYVANEPFFRRIWRFVNPNYKEGMKGLFKKQSGPLYNMSGEDLKSEITARVLVLIRAWAEELQKMFKGRFEPAAAFWVERYNNKKNKVRFPAVPPSDIPWICPPGGVNAKKSSSLGVADDGIVIEQLSLREVETSVGLLENILDNATDVRNDLVKNEICVDLVDRLRKISRRMEELVARNVEEEDLSLALDVSERLSRALRDHDSSVVVGSVVREATAPNVDFESNNGSSAHSDTGHHNGYPVDPEYDAYAQGPPLEAQPDPYYPPPEPVAVQYHAPEYAPEYSAPQIAARSVGPESATVDPYESRAPPPQAAATPARSEEPVAVAEKVAKKKSKKKHRKARSETEEEDSEESDISLSDESSSESETDEEERRRRERKKRAAAKKAKARRGKEKDDMGKRSDQNQIDPDLLAAHMASLNMARQHQQAPQPDPYSAALLAMYSSQINPSLAAAAFQSVNPSMYRTMNPAAYQTVNPSQPGGMGYQSINPAASAAAAAAAAYHIQLQQQQHQQQMRAYQSMHGMMSQTTNSSGNGGAASSVPSMQPSPWNSTVPQSSAAPPEAYFSTSAPSNPAGPPPPLMSAPPAPLNPGAQPVDPAAAYAAYQSFLQMYTSGAPPPQPPPPSYQPDSQAQQAPSSAAVPPPNVPDSSSVPSTSAVSQPVTIPNSSPARDEAAAPQKPAEEQ
mmetsp:Transcript_11017/g.19903  ORF Transcript_11017/g.19903 Transcript_11017/m.19903 type:complete len:892 (-) Transcript_11017:2203-4878(-)